MPLVLEGAPQTVVLTFPTRTLPSGVWLFVVSDSPALEIVGAAEARTPPSDASPARGVLIPYTTLFLNSFKTLTVRGVEGSVADGGGPVAAKLRFVTFGELPTQSFKGSLTVAVGDSGPDLSLPEVGVTASGGPVGEGGSASFSVDAGGFSGEVSYRVSQRGDVLAGGAGGDKTLTVTAGTPSAVSVGTVDDNVLEGGGEVTLTVLAGAGYRVSRRAGSASVSVTDDEQQVKVSAGSLSVAAGGEASYEVTLTERPPGPVTVTVEVSGGYGLGVCLDGHLYWPHMRCDRLQRSARPGGTSNHRRLELAFGADDWDSAQTVRVWRHPKAPPGGADLTHSNSRFGDTQTVAVALAGPAVADPPPEPYQVPEKLIDNIENKIAKIEARAHRYPADDLGIANWQRTLVAFGALGCDALPKALWSMTADDARFLMRTDTDNSRTWAKVHKTLKKLNNNHNPDHRPIHCKGSSTTP